MLHHFPLYLLVSYPSLREGVLTSHVEPNVLGETEFLKNEGVLEVISGFRGQGLGEGDGVLGPACARKDHDSFFFMFPVDESEFFKFAAIVADCDDVGFEFFAESFVGDALWLL